MEYRIFFSWQSDTDARINRSLIQHALREACDTLESQQDHRFFVDEATREAHGAVDIPASIENKVQRCDMFVGDVTIINKGTAERSTPNPNVMFEMGMAALSCGWDRVVPIFNENFGGFEILPFDIRHRRCMSYRLAEEDKDSKRATTSKLAAELVAAISSMTERSPKVRLQEIIKGLSNTTWRAYNHLNGQVDKTEVKGWVHITLEHHNIFTFDFVSFEGNDRFPNGDWQARFFVNEATLTTADLAFVSGVDFGFKRLMFPLDRSYDRIYIIGTPPYGNQVLELSTRAGSSPRDAAKG